MAAEPKICPTCLWRVEPKMLCRNEPAKAQVKSKRIVVDDMGTTVEEVLSWVWQWPDTKDNLGCRNWEKR